MLTPKIKRAVAPGWAIVQVAAALPHVFCPLRFLGHVIARSLSHWLAAAQRSKTISCDFGYLSRRLPTDTVSPRRCAPGQIETVDATAPGSFVPGNW